MNEIPKTKKTPAWAIVLSVAIVLPILALIVYSEFSSDSNDNSIKPNTEVSQNQYSYNGTSDRTIKVDLNKGLAIFTLKANCNGKNSIAVDFRKSDGSYYKGHLFNELGPNYSGSTSINIQETGTYVINVKINCKWSLMIE